LMTSGVMRQLLTWYDTWMLTCYDSSSWGVNLVDMARHMDIDLAWRIITLFPSLTIDWFSWMTQTPRWIWSTPDH
jgi:hypothetical protein